MALARIDTIPSLDLDALSAGLNGRLIRPGEPEYDAARRVHELRIDAYPVAIVKAADASDVALVVDTAQRTGTELAVRGGSHSVAGFSTGDGVIVLDLSGMKGLHIDPDRALVWAQAGLTAGEVTAALAEHGLAIPFGDTGSVGIAGLTLGGGIGYLARRHGLAIDHLEAVEIVTADGRLVTANAQEHADLFWAVRGGGGNFGVVTRFVYRAVRLPAVVYGGGLALPATPEVIAGYVAAAQAAPRELTTIAFALFAPPLPFVPADAVGQLMFFVTAVYVGDPADGEVAFRPFRELATPLVDMVGPMPYPAIYALTEGGSAPAAGFIRSGFMSGFDMASVEATVAAMRVASPGAIVQLRVLGGAVADVEAGATAFAHRSAPLLVAIMDHFEGGDGSAHLAWVDSLFRALRPGMAGAYANFVADGEERIGDAYPRATYDRLAAVKRAYDPGNVFHRNQNIRPA